MELIKSAINLIYVFMANVMDSKSKPIIVSFIIGALFVCWANIIFIDGLLNDVVMNESLKRMFMPYLIGLVLSAPGTRLIWKQI
jgi:hypothetical protein